MRITIMKKYLLLLSLLVLPSLSQAMQFYKLYPCSDQSCVPYILADGPIVPGTTAQFISFYNQNQAPYIYFNSNGGDVNEGMALGRVIKNAKLNTYISSQPYKYAYPEEKDIAYKTMGNTPVCTSACFLAFLGGVSHVMDDNAFIGTYNLNVTNSNPQERNFYQQTTSSIRQYSSEMGFYRDLLPLFNKNTNKENSIYWLTPEDISSFGLKTALNDETGWQVKNNQTVSYPFAYDERTLFNSSQKVGVSVFYDQYKPYMTFSYIFTNDNERKKFASYIENMNFTFNMVLEGKQYSTPDVKWKSTGDDFEFTIALSQDFVQRLRNTDDKLTLNFSYPQRAEYFKPDVTLSTTNLFVLLSQIKSK